MNQSFYQKLVDLYAGHELPEELEAEMQAAATDDPALAYDMKSMRQTVQLLRDTPQEGMSEVCSQRVLNKILEEANLPEAKPDDRDQYRFRFGG